MEKIELKHIAPYLPYNLMLECQMGNSDFCYKGLKKELWPLNILSTDGFIWKPLLHPISELDTDILIEELCGKSSDNILDFISYFNSDNENKDVAISQAPYPVVEWCLSKHFDVFNLISSGLAVSL